MSKNLRAGVFALLLFFIGALTAAAQQATPTPPPTTPPEEVEQPDEDPCPDAHTQFDLNQCAARARDKADAELNQAYRALMKDASRAERSGLRAAQLAWLKFRDAHCAYESAGNQGGSIYPMVVSFCLAEVTATRTAQLQKILQEQTEQ